MARRRALFSSLLVGLTMLGAFGLFAYWRSPTRGLPYHDSFAAGKAEEWQAFGGTWELAGGSMQDDSNERGAKLFTGSRYWQNYSIEGDVMLQSFSGYASDVGLILRSSDEEDGVFAFSGYFAALHTVRGQGSSLVLGRAGHGAGTIFSPLKPDVQPLRWYHLKLLAYGCQLVATAGLPSATPTVASMIDEDCLRDGRVGLQSSHSGGLWRNVVVRPATQRDVDQMLAQGQSQESSSAQSPRLEDVRGVSASLATLPDNQPQGLPPSPNTLPIDSLRLVSLAKQVKVTVSGQVILTSPALFVQDSTGGMVIHQSGHEHLKIGDEVEATGDASSNGLSSVLDNAKVHVLWEDSPTPAVAVTAVQAATGAFDSTFIEIEGSLRQKQYGPDGSLIFNFSSGTQSFRTVIDRDRGNILYSRLVPNSLVRLRGVVVVDPAYTENLTPFAVLIRSSDDVELLAGPPWWSTGHLVSIAVGLLIVAFVANVLYHRVENWHLRAVVEERENLAYEMHDTLAQSVAGIGFQLEAIRVGVPKDLSKVHQQLDLASELTRHSHAEARRSIDMLRPQELESQGLLNTLISCAHRLVAGGSVQIVATSTGDVRPLPLRTADALSRIGQEALANAVRHAQPTTLTITLEYGRDFLRLVIGDNGTGFVDNQEQRSLGVLGMRKRARSILAKLEIRCNPAEGTLVSVTASLPPRVTLNSWPVILWKFLREHTHNVTTPD
jgi:signal transduction histidine kinase